MAIRKVFTYLQCCRALDPSEGQRSQTSTRAPDRADPTDHPSQKPIENREPVAIIYRMCELAPQVSTLRQLLALVG